MTSVLQEQADKNYAKFTATIVKYHFTTAGLSPDPKLLEQADKNLALPEKENGSDFDDEEYFDLLRSGKPRLVSARALGADPKRIAKRLKFDIEFRNAVELAEEEAAEQIEEKLWAAANQGERWAMETWLKKRHKNRWGDDPTVVKHEGGITHELSAAPIVQQIVALQARLNERVALKNENIIEIADAHIKELP